MLVGGCPSHGLQAGDVHELPGYAVGLGGVEDDVACVAGNLLYGFGQFADGEVVADADVDEGGM